MRLLGENKMAIRAKISPLIMPADAFASVFVSLEESSSHRLSCKKNSFVHKIFFLFLVVLLGPSLHKYGAYSSFGL